MHRVWPLLLVCVASSACAEMGSEEYQSTGRIGSSTQRARTGREIETSQKREQEAERQAAGQRAEEQRQLQMQRQQRPLGAQLLEQRCGSCHRAALVQQAVRGELGWRWTVERMRWWHGARLEVGEAAALSAYLASMHGSDDAGRCETWGLCSLGLALLAWLVLISVRRWRHQRRAH